MDAVYGVGPLTAIEDAAIAYVLKWEVAHGRPCHDTRGTGAAADVAGAHPVTR